ncbi:LysR family transcriptional regulator [Kiloniella sp.]|uniref:LysR family transcriptional regulator n=1 Tax=Kiloniella sp. TaxID=1938587 RepID=UPI003B011103
MSRRPRLNQLRTFEAAARHLSFSLAAEELHVSQAAVSQQVRQLEDYLGAPLFVRNNRTISLSSGGQAYYPAVQEALDRLDTITDQLFPEKRKQLITVRCTPSIASLWLAPRLRQFHEVNPDIDVHIRTLDQLPGQPAHQECDLEIFVGGQDANKNPGVHKLWDSEIIPVCSPGYIEKMQNIGKADDLLNCDLIHVLGYENDWHRWFRTYCKGTFNIPRGFSVDGSLIALEAACRGEGVILGRRPLIDGYLKSAQLIKIFENPLPLFTTYFIRGHKKSANWRTSNILIDWLLDVTDDKSA